MEKDVFYLTTSVGQRKNQNFKIKVPIPVVNLPTTKSLWLSGRASERNLKVCGSILHGDWELFLYPTLVLRRQTPFSNFSFPCYHSLKVTLSDLLNMPVVYTSRQELSDLGKMKKKWLLHG